MNAAVLLGLALLLVCAVVFFHGAHVYAAVLGFVGFAISVYGLVRD